MLYNNPGGGTILFAPEVLDVFSRYQQSELSMTEAGGYLIGQQFENQLVVQVATEPDVGDTRKRFFFRRNKYRGQSIVDKIWEASGKKMIFAGEWHSHPDRFPVPSAIDIKQAIRSFSRGHFPLGFMVIAIVSQYAVVCSWVGIQTKSGLYRGNRIGYQLWRDD